jgi:hypothetical protein
MKPRPRGAGLEEIPRRDQLTVNVFTPSVLVMISAE